MSKVDSRLLMILLAVAMFVVSPQRWVCSEQPQHSEAIAQMVWNEEGTKLFAIDEVDLDHDGIAESIVTYPVGVHASHVRVLKWHHNTPTILYEIGCSTPNADFKTISGVPTIILEQSDYEPDYALGHRYQEFYQWNGKTFALNRSIR